MRVERELIILVFPISLGRASGKRRYETILLEWFLPPGVERITDLLSRASTDLSRACVAGGVGNVGRLRVPSRAYGGESILMRAHGTTAPRRDRMPDFDRINEVIGTEALMAEAQLYE
jgi:hypothetical protein